MKTRKLLAILLVLVMVMGMLPAGALGESSDPDASSTRGTISENIYCIPILSLSEFVYTGQTVTIQGIQDINNNVDSYNVNATLDLPVYRLIVPKECDKVDIAEYDNNGLWNTKKIHYTQKKVTAKVARIAREEYAFDNEFCEISDTEEDTIKSLRSNTNAEYSIAIYGSFTSTSSNPILATQSAEALAIILIEWENPSGGGSWEEPAEPITYTMSFDDAATIGTLNGRPVYRISLDGKAYDEIDFLPWIQTNAYALVKNATTDGSGVVFNPGSTEAVMAYGDELFNTVKQYYTDSKTEISLNSGITINETGSILLFQILEASNPFAVSVFGYLLIEWSDSSGGGSEYDIDIAADNNKLGEDNYGDSVYLITVPEGTTQISFVSSSSNKIDAIHDFYYTNEIIEQPIDLEDEYIVTLEGLISNCSGYGFESIYSSLPEGTYYGFSIDDTDGTYPYFLITDPSGGGSGEEDLGTYECADVTLETSTGQLIDDAPIYIITLAKGYNGLLFQQNSKYDTVKVSGDSADRVNVAMNTEIVPDSDLYNHAKQDYVQVIASAGIITEKSGYDYLLFSAIKAEFSFVTFTETITTVAYVIVEWEQSSGGGGSASVDKTALAAEIAKVWNGTDYTDNYYKEGDRYNGRPGETITDKRSGFWKLLIAEDGPLSRALAAFDDPNATQAQVDTAVADLSAAVDKLIPVTQINATTLYERISNYESNYYENDADRPVVNGFKQGVLLTDYTDPTVNAYLSVLSNAKAYLASLFDETGAPTAENISENQSVADGYADALSAAVLGLLSKEDVGMFDVYRKYISSLNSLFNETENSGIYTEDSWNTFTSASDAANAYMAEHPFTDARTGTELTQYRALAEAYWSACYNLTPVGEAAVTLRFADNVGAKYPDRAVASDLALYSASVTLNEESGYTLEALLTEAGIAGRLVPEGGVTYLVYVNGVLLRAPFYYESDYQYSVYLFDENNTDWNDVGLRDGDDVVVVRALMPTKTVYISLEYVGFGFVSDNFGTLQSRETEITVKAGEEFSVNISGAAGYIPDYDGRYSKRTNAEIIVYGPMQEDGSYPQNCTGIVTDGSGKASLTLLETGSYYITAADTRDSVASPDYFYPNLMAGSAPVRVTVEPLSSSELENRRNEYLTKLDTAYGGYSEGYYTSENWLLLNQTYADYRTAINEAATVAEMQYALDNGISAMKAVEAIDIDGVQSLFAHYLKYLPGVEQIENGYFTKADIERMGWIIELYGSMSDFQRSLLSSAQMTQYEALVAAYGEDGSGLPEPISFTVTVDIDETDLIHPTVASRVRAVYYDSNGDRQVFSSLAYTNYGFTGVYIAENPEITPSLTIRDFSHKTDSIEIVINIDKDYYDHFDGIEVTGAVVDDFHIEILERMYRYTYYILNPYHDFTVHVKAVNDPLQQAKNEALSALETAYSRYSRSDYLADSWEELTEAYIAGVQGINTADSEDAVITAKEAAIAAMAAVEKKGAGEYGSVTVIVENTTYQDAPFTGTVIPAVTVELQADSTMMGCVLKALKDNGYEWGGTGGTKYYITYLSYIYKDTNGNGKWDAGEKKLGEFDGGPEAGWMGTLNDWFVNESLANFTAANGKLTDGDVIRVLYTSAGLGTDLGATWENNDTSLKSLTVTGGSFAPVFDGDVTEYILSPQGGSVTLDAVASNKNFQVRVFLNEQNKSAGAEYYRSGETIPVKSGDVIWIGVGESSWASMNEGQITGTWYSLTVMTSDDASDVEKLIRDIGSVTYDNYKDRSSAVELARAAYDALTDTAKTQVSNYDVLTAAESAIAGYEDVDELKEELASLPNDMTKVSRGDLEKIKDDYDYLTDAQKALLTVAEQAKVERVIAALEGIIIEETALEKLSQDVSVIEGADWSVDQASANGAAALKSYIEEKLAAMSLNGNPTVDTVSVEPAVAGALTDPDGTDGSYSFTVTLSLDGVSQSVTVNDAVIKATEYIAPVDYEPVLKAVEQYLAEKVTDPAVASVGGEWAVFALNRGGVADSSWNYKYIENLKDYVDDCGGRLHDRKYTEYSRVVLALTSMGVDPTQFTTDNGTYDLVSPLLDKQNDTEYWAEWQGNNGTAFALLALDSHGYLNDEAGNAARARFIESLKAKQLEGGGWNIDSGAADLDTTAAVIYALAPYYLDATKLDALNCSVSHDELKAMVDSALEYLSGRQNANGGFGSAEADCWTIIALSSLGRDANSDAAFVKNGHTLLSDLLSYYDEATGAFRHLMSGSVDGMATEQAAYTLVAYDRFMKGQNTLYDMSDVTFRSGLSMAEELIDSITEPVSLTDEDKIEAARAAYDALSDEEKVALDPGKIAKLEAAERALSDLKVAKAEELIDAIGSPVRLSDENAIGKARNYYNNELSDAERERVGNYDKLTSAESALQKLKSETPQGQTKAVTVTINGVTYEVSEATKKAVEAMQAITDTTDPAEKLPNDFRDLTPEKEKQILDAYSLYKALTPDEKLFATNYDDFYKNVLLKLGESYHYDERTDTDARDNDDDILPWYVKMSVEDGLLTDKQKEDLASVLGEDFTERAVYRISFTDAFTGDAFEPDELISLSFPADGLDPSRTPVFVFVRDDGSFEFIDGRTVDGRLVMQATDFGTCAVTDSSYTWDEILSGGPAEPEEARSRSWALPAGIGIALLVIAGIVILIMRRRREDEE